MNDLTVQSSLHTFSNSVVIVDDAYLPPKLEMIQEEHWGGLRSAENASEWEPIREMYFPDVKRAIDLKRNDIALNAAWALYEKDSSALKVLNPIFAHVLASCQIRVSPLKEMMSYFEEAGITLLKHSSIESAVEDIKACKLVFLDFYLYQTDADEIIANVEKHKDLFASPITNGDKEDGRFVFLISTSLPSPEKLEIFRKTTKLKSAFFKPISKQSLSKDWLGKELNARIGRYDDMRRLSVYLDTFSRQIGKVADGLRSDIESLELHDLGILNSMRLEKESEHLGNYLGWLLSEALAAKIRESAPMLRAANEVDKIQGVPFQGTLVPKPILFDLYSEIAFSPVISFDSNKKTQFGDVFSVVPELSKSVEVTGSINISSHDQFTIELASVKAGKTKEDKLPELEELLLVVAPACDLQRCPLDYEILCVRGRITKHAPDLTDLLGQHSYFGKVEEGFKHLLRQMVNGEPLYSLVEWYPKQITTVRDSNLRDANKYKKMAKLNELFGQEVKEEALRHVGRVGIPVDPSFSSALGAVVRLKKPGKKQYYMEEAPDTFVSGILVSANDQNEARITLSEEFIQFLDQAAEDAELNNDKHKIVFSTLKESGGEGFVLPKKARLIDYEGGFKVRFVTDYVRGTSFSDNEIIFFPRDRITDQEEPEIESKPVVNKTDNDQSKILTDAPNVAKADDQTGALGTKKLGDSEPIKVNPMPTPPQDTDPSNHKGDDPASSDTLH